MRALTSAGTIIEQPLSRATGEMAFLTATALLVEIETSIAVFVDTEFACGFSLLEGREREREKECIYKFPYWITGMV